MSRKHGHKKHRARKRKPGRSPETLLAGLAAALNALEQGGITVHSPAVGVLTSHGAVIAFAAGWEVRPFAADGTPAPED